MPSDANRATPTASDGPVLTQPPAAPGTGSFPGRDEIVGAVIAGKYNLLEEIGEGGMGTVFLAQQTEPVRRQVAIKVIKAGMDSKAVLARFEAERQALAMMDHPNIAKVLDAGTTDSGRPFFVMELVQGVPITRFCDGRKLTPRERLQLFVPVCQAIQHAHQKGVIHRDVKPSNVLVAVYDDRPVPKVIDFGVAKATGQGLTDHTLLTGFGMVVGTPEYMSPEQAGTNPADVDTRSDVYSLGVLLYELLTGSTPVDRRSLGQAALHEILRIVREVEPPKPSDKLSSSDTLPSIAANRGTEPARLPKLLRGELDWVVMKALEKDRTRRYETANGLARDIQRYLADEVVEARPPTAGYRLRKFVRRNKGRVAAAALVLAALVVGVVGTTAGLIEARRQEAIAVAALADKGKALRAEEEQRRRADANFAKASETVNEYFTVVSENKLLQSPLPGLQPLRKELLDAALLYYREFAAEHAADPALRAELAKAYFRCGRIAEEIGPVRDARQAYLDSIAIWRQIVGDNPTDAMAQLELAHGCRRLGHLLTHNALGPPGDAHRTLEEARGIYQSVAAAGANASDAKVGLGETYAALGRWYFVQNKPADEGRTLALAYDLWAALAAADPAHRRRFASAAMSVGYYRTRTGAVGEALAKFDQARTILEQLHREAPGDVETRAELRRTFTNIAYAHHLQTRKVDVAKEYYAKALEVAEGLSRENPAVTQYKTFRAGACLLLAKVAKEQGRDAEAVERVGQAVAIAEEQLRAEPTSAQQQYELAEYLAQSADIDASAGRWDRAAETAAKARGLLEPLNRANPAHREYASYLAQMWSVTAMVRIRAGQLDEGFAAYKSAFDTLEPRVNGPSASLSDVSDLAFSYFAAAGAYQKALRTAEAEAALKRAFDLRLQLLDRQPGNVRYVGHVRASCHALADVHVASDRRDDAVRVLIQGRDAMRKVPQPQAGHWMALAQLCARLASLRGAAVAEARTDADEAMAALERAAKADGRIAPALRRDAHLTALRDRDDFKKLLAGLEAKTPLEKEADKK